MARKPGQACQIWFTEDEVKTMEKIARKLIRDPSVRVTRTDVIRGGIRLMADKWLPVEEEQVYSDDNPND